MKIACLCPTYNRPELLASSLAMFLDQSHSDKKLFIFDDGGQYENYDCDKYKIISSRVRCDSLPAKYSLLRLMAEEWRPDAVAMWDDDDIYLSHHLASVAAKLDCEYQWTAPTMVWSTYTGKPVLEDSTGRFWASCAVRWDAFEQVGGVPLTKRGDFDQMFLGNCRRILGPPVSLADNERDATFVFRWNDTNAPHAQHFLRSPDDATWYDRMKQASIPYVGKLVPKLDERAERTIQLIREALNLPVQSDAPPLPQ